MNLNYVTGIPNAANNPSTDQPNMLINTNSAALWPTIDHFGYSDNNGGFHLKSTYVSNILSLNVPPVTVAGQVAVYAANTAPGNILAYVRDGQATGIPLTLAYNPVAGAGGFTFMPGGIIIQWGQVTVSPSAMSGNVSFLAQGGMSFPNNAFSINLTMKLGGAASPHGIWISTSTGLATSGFSWNSDLNVPFFYYIAIGN